MSKAARRWFWITVALYAGAWLVALGWLPERVPLHFGGSGGVDRWGTRAQALVGFAALGVGLGALLGGTAAFSDRIPPALLNTPRKDWWTATPERLADLRRRNRDDLYVIAAATQLLVTAVVLETVRAARSPDPHLGPVFFVCLGAYLVFVAAWVVRTVRDRTSTIDG